MKRIRVENSSNLYRDTRTNAIINTNTTEYTNYMNSIKHKKKELSKIKQIENDVKSLKDDLKEIKDLLKCLIKE